MKTYHLYLPLTSDDDIFCQRFIHLFQSIDHEFQEVRIYKVGIDIDKKDMPAVPASLPFALKNGELITFTDLFNEVMVKSGRFDPNDKHFDEDTFNEII